VPYGEVKWFNDPAELPVELHEQRDVVWACPRVALLSGQPKLKTALPSSTHISQIDILDPTYNPL